MWMEIHVSHVLLPDLAQMQIEQTVFDVDQAHIQKLLTQEMYALHVRLAIFNSIMVQLIANRAQLANRKNKQDNPNVMIVASVRTATKHLV